MNTATKQPENTKEKRIEAEKKRLEAQFAEIPEKRMEVIAGLIERAAFARISLQDLEKELNAEGFASLFKQGEKQEAYYRENPQAKCYNTLFANYLKTISQLSEFLPAVQKSKKDEPLEILLENAKLRRDAELEKLKTANLSISAHKKRRAAIIREFEKNAEALGFDDFDMF